MVNHDFLRFCLKSKFWQVKIQTTKFVDHNWQPAAPKIFEVYYSRHSAIRNKHEKSEGNGEARFETPLTIENDAESMKRIVGAL